MCHATLNKIIPLGVNAPIWVWVSTVTGIDWSEGFWVNVVVGSRRGREAQRACPGPLTHFNVTRLRIVNTDLSDYLGLIKDPSSSKINKQTMFSF